MTFQVQPHILLITFPAQGHINPSLQFTKRLLRLGVKVTFATSISAYRKMTKAGQVPESINFAAFSDGFDDGYKPSSDDTLLFLSKMRTQGSQSLKHTILASAKNGSPVTCVVYTLLLPWAAEVARGLNVPSTLLWIQPAAVLDIYYYYFNGYDKLICDHNNEPSWTIQFPGLPLLRSRDLPSFCLPSDTYNFGLPLFKEQLEEVSREENPKILVNTFETLEGEALKAIHKFKMIPVGPLIPSAFLGEGCASDTSFGGDLIESSTDYKEWMNMKPERSIIYVSFGSIIVLTKQQKEAIAEALLNCGMSFLWVIRDKETVRKGDQKQEEEEEELSCMEELEQLGKIVSWCRQLEVLSHPSLGCFVTHCGWNSTLESLICGVPVVAFPHWTDQGTNAKFLEDVWGTGVRVIPNADGLVESKEIQRCIQLVMGEHERAETMKKKAMEWKHLGREAMKEGGSSDMNLKTFVESVAGSTKNVLLESCLAPESKFDAARSFQ